MFSEIVVQVAYATAVLMKFEICNGVNVQLVQVKSRVSRVRRMTIPRMKLLTTTLGARLSLLLLTALIQISFIIGLIRPLFYLGIKMQRIGNLSSRIE